MKIIIIAVDLGYKNSVVCKMTGGKIIGNHRLENTEKNFAKLFPKRIGATVKKTSKEDSQVWASRCR